jgi:hypothetical protein
MGKVKSKSPSKLDLALSALDDYGERTRAMITKITKSQLSPKTKLRRILTLPVLPKLTPCLERVKGGFGGVLLAT